MTAIEHETDAAHKQALLEEFVQTYTGTLITAWAYTQLEGIYLQGQQYDKALDAGTRSLALDPKQPGKAAYGNLKTAEAKSDTALIAKWGAETARIAHGAATAAPAGDTGAKGAV